MTREILFRAKRKDNGEWVEGNLLHFDDAYPEYENLIIPAEDANLWSNSAENEIGIDLFYKLESDTICQYTGLVDKNGTKIFENDVVSIGGELCTVRWQKDTARFVLNDDVARAHCDFGNYWGYDLEVVGNIFENQTSVDEQNETYGV